MVVAINNNEEFIQEYSIHSLEVPQKAHLPTFSVSLASFHTLF